MNKKSWVTILIIVCVIILSIMILTKSFPDTNKEVIKCIGQNSILYTQFGCHACNIQEDMFGENYKYLDVIDCFYERDKCIAMEITGTPTWLIGGIKDADVKSIEELKELTGC